MKAKKRKKRLLCTSSKTNQRRSRCRLVTREGSVVTVKDVASIPEFDSASSLEKFTQLMNLEEYEEAIR